MITIVDSGTGNIFSIRAALQAAGAEVALTDSPERVRAAEKIVLPGVGAFGDVAGTLRARGLWDAVGEVARRGTPYLGICVGMQLLADRGEEFGLHEGLGLISGAVRLLRPYRAGEDGFRIPNVGWRPLRLHAAQPVCAGIDGEMMYFVHSFALDLAAPERTLIASIRCNGADVAAIVGTDNIVGCQFHPERSGPAGLRLIKGFVDWRP